MVSRKVLLLHSYEFNQHLICHISDISSNQTYFCGFYMDSEWLTEVCMLPDKTAKPTLHHSWYMSKLSQTKLLPLDKLPRCLRHRCHIIRLTWDVCISIFWYFTSHVQRGLNGNYQFISTISQDNFPLQLLPSKFECISVRSRCRWTQKKALQRARESFITCITTIPGYSRFESELLIIKLW